VQQLLGRWPLANPIVVCFLLLFAASQAYCTQQLSFNLHITYSGWTYSCLSFFQVTRVLVVTAKRWLWIVEGNQPINPCAKAKPRINSDGKRYWNRPVYTHLLPIYVPTLVRDVWCRDVPGLRSGSPGKHISFPKGWSPCLLTHIAATTQRVLQPQAPSNSATVTGTREGVIKYRRKAFQDCSQYRKPVFAPFLHSSYTPLFLQHLSSQLSISSDAQNFEVASSSILLLPSPTAPAVHKLAPLDRLLQQTHSHLAYIGMRRRRQDSDSFKGGWSDDSLCVSIRGLRARKENQTYLTAKVARLAFANTAQILNRLTSTRSWTSVCV